MIMIMKRLFLLISALSFINLAAEVNVPVYEREAFMRLSKQNIALMDPEREIKDLNIFVRDLSKAHQMGILGRIFAGMTPTTLEPASDEGGFASNHLGDNHFLLDNQVWNDLELFSSEDGGLRSVFNKIDRTQTSMGGVMLQKLLITPLTDIDVLRGRQNFIKQLVEDEGLFNSLEQLLQEVAKNENVLVSFWDDRLDEEIKAKHIVTPKLSHEELGGTRSMDAKYSANFYKQHESNWFKIESWRRAKELGVLLWAICISLVPLASLNHAGMTGYQTFQIAYKEGNYQSLLSHSMAFLLNAAVGNIPTYLYNKKVINKGRLLKRVMQEFSSFFESAKQLISFMKQSEVSSDHLKGLDTSIGLLNAHGKTHNDIAKLYKLLSSSAVTSKDTLINYLFRFTGKVYAAYNLLRKERNKFRPLLESIGMIDAYMSIARLYKESLAQQASGSNGYSFAQYEDASRPHVKLTGLWHPMIDPAVAIASDFELGGESGSHNGVFSGPNAGGKSTSLRAITLNILFAQTLGVVPSREAIVTPFSDIKTYLNVNDDLLAGKSQFKMEVERAKELVDAIKSMPRDRFIFSIMDELFSGTNPAEGQAAAYSIARSLGELPNSMLVLASHYPVIRQLEQHTNGNFKNFKIKANIRPISYPYKIFEGASNQAIAMEILREEGFDTGNMLKYAEDMLVNPGKYGT